MGIGISGKEGLQAARISDYSIAQFRFLQKLLLVHGRWNYVRIGKYILATFWKELMFYLIQALYQKWCGYSGTSIYESTSLTVFNTLFTSLPVIFLGIFEQDLATSTLLAVPELYLQGQRNEAFNIKKYLGWMFIASSEAMIIYFLMFELFGEAVFTRDDSVLAQGQLCFTAAVVFINTKLLYVFRSLSQCSQLSNTHNPGFSKCTTRLGSQPWAGFCPVAGGSFGPPPFPQYLDLTKAILCIQCTWIS